MTNKGVKLYKFDNHTTSADKIATAKGTDGAIIWIVDLRELWVGNSNAAEAKLILKGAIDVSLNNDTLTITHYNTDGTTTTGTLQFEEVADGLVKDGTPSYTSGHYVIENGKLVSASGKSSGDTYTISANDGYTKASDVKAYVGTLEQKVLSDEKVVQEAVNALCNSSGFENDFSLDLSDDTTDIISNDDNIKDALLDLADAINSSSAGQVDDVKIDNVSILSNKVANIVTEEVADGLVKDGTASYTSGHYVIENGKLVSAVGKSTGDTYTISQNDGLTKASDVKAYVDTLEQKVIDNEEVVEESFSHISDSIGLENDFSLDLSNDQTGIIHNDDNIKDAVQDLANEIVNNEEVVEETIRHMSDSIGLENDLTIDFSDDTTYIIHDIDNARDAIQALANAVNSIQGSFDIIKSINAATTPAGVTWEDTSTQPPTTITGTLQASANTSSKIYLVPSSQTQTRNVYAEYITAKETVSGTTTYSWEKLGDITVDLTGYVRTITVNGKTYEVPQNSVNINLGSIITGVTGETAISGGESGLVAVTPTPTTDSSTGSKTVALATTVKIEEVADGLVKDGTPSYTSGHYVIENGKLVSAVGKSTGDTYTISSNDGLTKASDVKAYVDTLEQKVLSDEKVVQEAVNALCNSSGFENDFSLDLSDDTTDIISNDDNIKDALLDLADAIDGGGQVNDVKIDNVSILSNKVANIVTEEVADGLVKDGTPSYTSGHYVIENGKLVSAVGKLTGDTYTISQNDGLTKASDVKAYVDTLEQKVIDNEEVVEETFSHISDSIGLENDLTIDFSDDQTGIIHDKDNVKDALQNISNMLFEIKFNGHEYVDLGVTLNNKKLYFAKCNVGATTETGYGTYYSWAEVESKGDYQWSTYKWGDVSTFSKYNSSDGKVLMDLEDDIVHVAMGGQWRSPTGAEQEALLNQTTNAWVTDYNGSGINGRVFTGTNGNTMFVPAAGYRNGTSFGHVGSRAYWWSSSLYGVGSVSGRRLVFDSSDCGMYGSYRYYGFSARGVVSVEN